MTPRPQAKPMIRLLVYLPPELYEWVNQRAGELGVSKTALVVALLETGRDGKVEFIKQH